MSTSRGRIKYLLVFVGVSLSLISLSGGKASAATKTWANNPSSANWSAPASWTPAGAPVDGDNITFTCANSGDCQSVFDMPGLSVGNISFSGTLAGNVLNLTGAPIVVNGGITSAATGSTFQGSVVLGANITVNNTVLVAVDLNDHTLTITGKGVVNSSNSQTWIGISGDIIGDGTLVINADSDQEVYLSGGNLYSGTTTISGGKFVSNGQSTSNHTLDMFGVSDVNVGSLGKVTFTFDQSETGFAFLNKITFNRTDNTLAQLLLINKSTNNSAISIGFSNVNLSSNTRFDVDVSSGDLAIDLTGHKANGHCIEFGAGNVQSTYFVNGPNCSSDPNNPTDPPDPANPTDPSNSTKPPTGKVNAPKTGVVVATAVVGSSAAAIGGAGLYLKKKRKVIDTLSEK